MFQFPPFPLSSLLCLCLFASRALSKTNLLEALDHLRALRPVAGCAKQIILSYVITSYIVNCIIYIHIFIHIQYISRLIRVVQDISKHKSLDASWYFKSVHAICPNIVNLLHTCLLNKESTPQDSKAYTKKKDLSKWTSQCAGDLHPWLIALPLQLALTLSAVLRMPPSCTPIASTHCISAMAFTETEALCSTQHCDECCLQTCPLAMYMSYMYVSLCVIMCLHIGGFGVQAPEAPRGFARDKIVFLLQDSLVL